MAEDVVRRRDDVTFEILDISDADNMFTALMLQIASTPSFAIDDTPVFLDGVPSVEELNARIDDYKRRQKP